MADVTDMERIAKCITRFAWSPCLYKDGHRHETCFIGSYWCAYDFDDGEFTIADAVNTFADMRHVIGTTKTHQQWKTTASGRKMAPCDRFRVVIPWDEPIKDLRTYRFNMTLQRDRYDMDRSCIDGARLFWPCVEIVSINNDEADGEFAYAREVRLDVPDDFESLGSDHERTRSRFVRNGMLPTWAARWLYSEVIPVGRRNTTVYGLAKDLALAGFDQDTIVAKILACPTYRPMSNMPMALLREIRQTVANGVKAVRRLQVSHDNASPLNTGQIRTSADADRHT